MQLVESQRDKTGRPLQRIVSAVGHLDGAAGQVDLLLKGLLRAKGMQTAMAEPPIGFRVCIGAWQCAGLDQLCKEVGFDALCAVFRKARYTTPMEHAICLLVFIRWRDVDPKLGVLRCLQTLSMTQIEVDALTHQNLLRSLDVLLDHHEAGDDMLPKLLCHLVNQHLSLAF